MNARVVSRAISLGDLNLTAPAGHHGGRPVRVVSPGALVSVNAATRSITSAFKGAMRDGRPLSRHRQSTPAAMKRSCQRRTQVFNSPV